jgi:ATP adenylyltransferase
MMIYKNPTNPNAHLTVKDRKQLSMPSRILLEQNCLIGDILDFGCGMGKDVEELKHKGLDMVGYDPYYFKDFPKQKFDTIICHYVLNVLLPDEQTDVLMNVSYLLKPTGKAYFTVRRDIRKNDFLYNPKQEARTYQCNVTLPYTSIFKNENCEIYEYRNFNQLNYVTEHECKNCKPVEIEQFLFETATCLATFKGNDDFLIVNVIPKRHCESYFDYTFREQSAMWFAVNKVKQLVQKDYLNLSSNISIKVCNDSLHPTVEVVFQKIVPS